jgi:hypothetical protein
MSVKFRVGFDIDAETLFGMIAKMLPIENLAVEELAPAKAQPRIPHVPKPAAKIARRPRPNRGPDLKAGINRIIVEMLADGKTLRAVDFEAQVERGGYARNSVSSRLDKLKAHGVVEKLPDQTWRLVK